MPIYVYETIPTVPDQAVRRFEIKQSMSEPALTQDPETGAPVRRIISGGYGLMTKADGGDCADGSCAPPRPTHSCGTGCGCFPG